MDDERLIRCHPMNIVPLAVEEIRASASKRIVWHSRNLQLPLEAMIIKVGASKD
jgi:hypothetical protein